MAKTYFRAGDFDSLIKSELRVKTEKREGSNALHVIYTDEANGLADHTVVVQGITILFPQYTPEGYSSNLLTEIYLSKEAIIALSDKIKTMDGSIINCDYHKEHDDDLPF